MIVTARDLLTEDVPRVPAEARPADYERDLASGRVVAFAVFEGEAFLGLAEPATMLTFPQRIFADLCSRAAPPIGEAAPLEEILQEMGRRGTSVLAVMDPEDRFLGVVSSFRITELLLWQAESRLQGIRQLLATTVDLGSDWTLEEVLQRVVDLAAQLTGAREGALEIFDDKGEVAKRLVAGPASSLGFPRLRAGVPGTLDTSAPRPSGTNRASPDPDSEAQAPGAAPLAVPLRLRGRTLGRLAVWDKERIARFTGEDQVLLSALADQAAIAVENGRLFQARNEQLDELRRTQAHLLQAEKLSAMGQLLASVAHELNNPLAVVVGHTALLERSLAGTPHGARAEQINQAAQRCARIVRNYLALARQRPPEREAVEVNAVIREALELFAYALRVDDVEVTLDLADNLPLLAADPHQLHQVIVNLVTNAHHALREVHPPRRLRLATRRGATGDRVWIEVSDTGPGIPPEVQARLFEPFFTTKRAGTGLGLSLCQSIVEGHRGTIEVESRQGEGATFRIALPLGKLPAPSHEPLPVEALAAIRGRTILLVDDEPAILEVLAEILAEDGHVIATASNGSGALKKLEQQTYDLILVDIRMPAVDGPGFYRAVTARHPAFRERFVFMTGDVLNPDVRTFLDETARPVLRKPFTAAQVRETAQRALRMLGERRA